MSVVVFPALASEVRGCEEALALVSRLLSLFCDVGEAAVSCKGPAVRADVCGCWGDTPPVYIHNPACPLPPPPPPADADAADAPPLPAVGVKKGMAVALFRGAARAALCVERGKPRPCSVPGPKSLGVRAVDRAGGKREGRAEERMGGTSDKTVFRDVVESTAES